MVKKLLALAAVMLFATAGAAHAQQDPNYPLSGNTVTANDTTLNAGDPVTLSAKTFAPGTLVTFTLFSAPVVLGTATADSSGVATLVATIPSGVAAGSHTVQATGTGANGQPLTVTLSITVGGTGGSNLPTTGAANTRPMTQVAIAAIAGGGLLVLLATRRRGARAAERDTAGV